MPGGSAPSILDGWDKEPHCDNEPCSGANADDNDQPRDRKGRPSSEAQPKRSDEAEAKAPTGPQTMPPLWDSDTEPDDGRALLENDAPVSSRDEPNTNRNLIPSRGLAEHGWFGGWLAVGPGGIGAKKGAAWNFSGRLDASPVESILVGVKGRYNWNASFDGEAIAGFIVSHDYEQAYEGWFTEDGMVDRDIMGREIHQQTHYRGPLVTMRIDWAMTGGVRFARLFETDVQTPTHVVVTAGLDRLKTNSDGQRYTFSARALYNPSGKKWGGAVHWMYANPPTWRFTYGLEAGILPLADSRLAWYLAIDLGLAMGT